MKKIIPLYFLLFLYSCTGLKGSKSSSSITKESNHTTENIIATELNPGNKNDDSDTNWHNIIENAEKNEKYIAFDIMSNDIMNELSLKDVAKTISPSDTHHVRNTNYDPLKDKDFIFYDFSKFDKKWHYPIDGKLISNYGMRSGRMHTGVDIKGQKGDNVYAVFDGVVRLSKQYSGYGNTIVLRHPNGLETVYSHNSRNIAKVGDIVRAGDVIAKVGRTGRASTEHVHFEVRVTGQCINPNNLIDTQNKTLKKKLYIYKKGSTIYASNSTPNKKESTKKTEDKVDKPKDNESKDEIKKYTSAQRKYHTIKRGDTLGLLAKKYNTSVSRICRLNRNLTSRTILKLDKKIRIK